MSSCRNALATSQTSKTMLQNESHKICIDALRTTDAVTGGGWARRAAPRPAPAPPRRTPAPCGSRHAARSRCIVQARTPGRRRRSPRRADLGAAPVSLARSAAVRAEGRHPHRLAHRSHHAPQLLFALGAPGADRLQRLVAVDECSVACFAVSSHLRCRPDVSEAPARRVQVMAPHRRERGRQL